ncbi:MAG: NusG domain II-containing protein [Clostridia bacterium]|nr:NusG domain II-containing protein [Clostridia bacterium]
MRLRPKIGDFIIIIIIIAAALLLVLTFYEKNSVEKTAIITQNNSVLKTIRLDLLSQDLTIHYQGKYPGTIEAKNGQIRFLHAECPDKVCVHTGWISRPGQIAVCLPAGVMIKITGKNTDMDILLH